MDKVFNKRLAGTKIGAKLNYQAHCQQEEDTGELWEKASLCGFTFNIVKLKLVDEAQFTAKDPLLKSQVKQAEKKGQKEGKPIS